MFRHVKSVAIGAATAVIVFSAVAGATAAFGSGTAASASATAPGQPPAAPLRPNVQPQFQVTGRTAEMNYVPVVSCPLMDTRLAGGPFAAGATRNYDARGTGSFAAQGGSKAGCGIPTNAAALALNVLALSPRAAGHVKIMPYKGAGTGTIVNYYNAGQTISGSVNADIAAPGSHAFTLINLGGPTDITADVTGYYIAPMFAHVTDLGALVFGSRVTSVSRLSSAGEYEVDFDRDVTRCSYAGSSYTSETEVEVEPRNGNANGVFVFLTNTANAAVDEEFFLTVTC